MTLSLPLPNESWSSGIRGWPLPKFAGIGIEFIYRPPLWKNDYATHLQNAGFRGKQDDGGRVYHILILLIKRSRPASLNLSCTVDAYPAHPHVFVTYDIRMAKLE